MMSAELRHTWIIAPYRVDRLAQWKALQPQETVYSVNCHRYLHGPYTGLGSLLRQLVPTIYQTYPEHIHAHVVEILSAAPELKSFLTVSTETLTTLAVPVERTRFYSRLRTLRLAHGIIDFLKGCIRLGAADHYSIFFDNVQAAESLDQEFIIALLRRADPAKLTIAVGTTLEALPQSLEMALTTYTQRLEGEPPTRDYSEPQFLGWQSWLLAHSQGWAGEYEPLQEIAELSLTRPPEENTFEEGMGTLVERAPAERRLAWAKAFIEADCTSDVLLERLAYQLLDASTRQQWHDERADLLEVQERWSLRLGAIPYHRERGQHARELGIVTLKTALDYCINMGYYEATVDFGYRGRALIDPSTQMLYYWIFTTKNTTSLAALGHPEEAEPLYNEMRALTSQPTMHMQAAYATAMLYTRHYSEGRRDHTLAKAWINQAIAIASLLPDAKERAFNTVFNENGLALIEGHLGHPQEALRLVTEGLERLNRELEPDEHLLHRSVLLYNRAQVYAGLGQLDKALADFTAVIQQDSYYSEYYFDRGNIYRRLGRDEEALADYERAIAYSPPYCEAYYNRAGVLSVLGRDEEALADYSYVLELDPTYLDALVNRASMLYERGDYGAARRDIDAGLQLDANNAQLLCTLGLVEMAEEHAEKAYKALSSAVQYDPSLVAAWTNRAIVAFEQGKSDAAIDDLSCALALEENATVLYNRGIAYQACEHWLEAISDFSRALALTDEDAQDILYRRSVCHMQMGEIELAHQDFNAHLTAGPSAYEVLPISLSDVI